MTLASGRRRGGERQSKMDLLLFRHRSPSLSPLLVGCSAEGERKGEEEEEGIIITAGINIPFAYPFPFSLLGQKRVEEGDLCLLAKR